MAMKSTSQGSGISRIRSAMKKTAPLSTPISRRSRPSYSEEISRPSSATRSRSCSSETRISPTPGSRCASLTAACLLAREASPFIFPRRPHSVLVARRRHDPRHGDDLLALGDERPGAPLRTGNLGVYEHVLNLLFSSGQPIAGLEAAYL